MTEVDFWSRRRAAVAAEAEAEARAQIAAETEAREAAQAEQTDEELLAELELPAPETLDDPERLRAFLNETVPQRLKTRALRHMWRLNPVLANLDGLVDYGEDFTDASTVIEGLQTAYQVGKGMLAHVEALAAEAEAAAQPAEDIEPQEAAADEAPIELAEAAPEMPMTPAVPEPEPTPAPEDDIAPLPRRMRFAFDDTPAASA